MEKKAYYLDTCIWLNFFNKYEWHWKEADQFIRDVAVNEEKIFVSTIVLKELRSKLGERFDEAFQSLKKSSFAAMIKTTNEDYINARAYEREHHMLGFQDYLHVAIAKRLDVPLITRDKNLLIFAKDHVRAYKPEELIC